MRHLANHLVENHCVDTRSVAALTLLSQRTSKSPTISTSTTNVVHSTNSTVSTSATPSPCTTSSSLQNTPVNVKSFSNSPSDSKHREAQIQLQRKLHEREVIREQKRKLQVWK